MLLCYKGNATDRWQLTVLWKRRWQMWPTLFKVLSQNIPEIKAAKVPSCLSVDLSSTSWRTSTFPPVCTESRRRLEAEPSEKMTAIMMRLLDGLLRISPLHNVWFCCFFFPHSSSFLWKPAFSMCGPGGLQNIQSVLSADVNVSVFVWKFCQTQSGGGKSDLASEITARWAEDDIWRWDWWFLYENVYEFLTQKPLEFVFFQSELSIFVGML